MTTSKLFGYNYYICIKKIFIYKCSATMLNFNRNIYEFYQISKFHNNWYIFIEKIQVNKGLNKNREHIIISNLLN